jgi:hypothetical protein
MIEPWTRKESQQIFVVDFLEFGYKTTVRVYLGWNVRCGGLHLHKDGTKFDGYMYLAKNAPNQECRGTRQGEPENRKWNAICPGDVIQSLVLYGRYQMVGHSPIPQ